MSLLSKAVRKAAGGISPARNLFKRVKIKVKIPTATKLYEKSNPLTEKVEIVAKRPVEEVAIAASKAV
jgi:hypothetical protein